MSSGAGTPGLVDLGDYGFLSDCTSAAIVSRTGSIDWWCPGRFDAPSVFGRLLDTDAGHWTLGPTTESPAVTTWSYVAGTLVLRTVLDDGDGSVEIVDALALEPGARGHEIGLNSPLVLLRRVTGLRGSVCMTTELVPRFEYGRVTPYLIEDGDAVLMLGGPTTLTLRADVPLEVRTDRVRADFIVAVGETVKFRLAYTATYAASPTAGGPPRPRDAESSGEPVPTAQSTIESPDRIAPDVDQTIASWRSWSAQHTSYEGRYRDEVLRSTVVLQGLTYQRTGAVVAAATTSLPEKLGGAANFDYRFAWLRDFALTMRALWVAACPDETDRLLDWVARSAGRVGGEPVPIMYGVEGERDVSEHELAHLLGYGGSSPVRVGNEAWRQRQLDVLGEVVDAAYLLRKELDDLGPESRELLVALADQAAASWREPDAGMWEARDKDRHYVSSKIMCWVALDRAVRMVDLLEAQDSLQGWKKARDEVHAEVMARGWNETVHAFTGAFESDELDASVLIVSLVGFLPGDDPRVLATIRAIEEGLGADGLLRRWKDEPSAFLTCSFWLSECYSLAGDFDRAAEVFESAAAFANELGIFTEEVEIESGMRLGNLPQAICHVGLINAAWRLTAAEKQAAGENDADGGSPQAEPPGPGNPDG